MDPRHRGTGAAGMSHHVARSGEPLVAFVTVNWRSADVVGQLLHSLECSVAFPYEAVVVNNDAQESTHLDTICRSHTCASLVDVQRNVGFAAACNEGANQ